ncbi:hypothetical protein G9U51_13220 [Calidifontibacter sp. DB0510]|uniref:Peptidoglycan-binding protein n=1 Tax=Metallococcus carri TaxID=1656884 RepID=A0A967B1T7_9MICO|nr:peptidoglycan-binding protein [Metallococcus carri]NHN56738.1 hypothetical protein [Metallococcus carri]NOP37885.1 hypothetical protein [Calidifontibacter sp. DB2511S]
MAALSRRGFVALGAASTTTALLAPTARAAGDGAGALGSGAVPPQYRIVPGSTPPPPRQMMPYGVNSRESLAATTMATAPNHYATGFPTVQSGSPWQDVRALQYLLYNQGISTNWEGSFGASTSAACSVFQGSHGLPRTGVGDPATLAKLTPNVGYGANSYLTYAVQTLLRKHGYHFEDYYYAPKLSTNYGAVTDSYVQAFQTGHAIGAANYVGYYTWRTLFAARTRGPLYPLMQYGTGSAQWTNCGPTSAVMILLAKGLWPRNWYWNTSLRTNSVTDFRYWAMGLPNTPERNAMGSEIPELTTGFAKYGIRGVHNGISDTVMLTKQGVMSIAGGDAYRLPWKTYVSGPASHWIAVVGWDGTYFLVMDPIAQSSASIVHRMTEQQLRWYAGSNPGWETNPRMSPPNYNSLALY